jgi:hypothetical protein
MVKINVVLVYMVNHGYVYGYNKTLIGYVLKLINRLFVNTWGFWAYTYPILKHISLAFLKFHILLRPVLRGWELSLGGVDIMALERSTFSTWRNITMHLLEFIIFLITIQDYWKLLHMQIYFIKYIISPNNLWMFNQSDCMCQNCFIESAIC